MRKLIVCDPDRCVGCQICEFVCSTAKEKSIDSSLSRIHTVNYEPLGNIALSCVFCEKPACVAACPRKALHQNEKGVIQVDETKCNGCGWCIRACDFGAITMHPIKNVVSICDLCDGELKCVKSCPFEDALIYSDLEEVAHKLRRRSVVKLLQEFVGKTQGSA